MVTMTVSKTLMRMKMNLEKNEVVIDNELDGESEDYDEK